MINGGIIDMSYPDCTARFAKAQMSRARILDIARLCLVIAFAIGVEVAVPQVAFAADVTLMPSNSELAKAEQVAKLAFKKAAGRKVGNFTWRLIVEDQTEWVFSFEDLDAPAVPGSDYFITVKKDGYKASVRHGY